MKLVHHLRQKGACDTQRAATPAQAHSPLVDAKEALAGAMVPIGTKPGSTPDMPGGKGSGAEK